MPRSSTLLLHPRDTTTPCLCYALNLLVLPEPAPPGYAPQTRSYMRMEALTFVPVLPEDVRHRRA
jgi:hypothetical protein